MTSKTDIVKYSATIWVERREKGHSLFYFLLTLSAAVIMLAFQSYLIYGLNKSSDAMLFCGDVVRMIETEKRPQDLFKDDSVQSYN